MPLQGIKQKPALQSTEMQSDTEASISSCLAVSEQDSKQLAAHLAGHGDHEPTSQWLPKFVELLAGLGLSSKECTSSAVNLLTCNVRMRRTSVQELTRTVHVLLGKLQTPARIRPSSSPSLTSAIMEFACIWGIALLQFSTALFPPFISRTPCNKRRNKHLACRLYQA